MRERNERMYGAGVSFVWRDSPDPCDAGRNSAPR
jgi:hypothetical protein